MTAAPPAERGGTGAVDTTAPASGFPDRLPALTSVRFLLALGVVLFHYQLNIVPEGGLCLPLIERARLAVDFFFILSGFVLAHVYGRQVRNGTYNHKRFLIARLARIYPAHFAMMVLMAIIILIAIALDQPFVAESYSMPGFVSALTLTHAWLPATVPNEWNGPSWSLSAEWAAYLAFPIFAFIGLKAGRRPWAVILLSVVLFVVLDALYRGIFKEQLTHAELVLGVLRIIPEFLFGIGLYQLGSGLRCSRRAAALAAIGSVVGLLCLMAVSADERLIVATSGAVILSLALWDREEADSIFNHPLLLEAGEASYALYLVHLPLLIIWKNGMAMLSGTDSSYPRTVPEATILLIVTLVSAFALHAFWERPARALIRSLFLTPSSQPEKGSS